MTIRTLSDRASLEHLRNEAKSSLKTWKAGDASVLTTLRFLPRLAEKSDEEILANPQKLNDVHHALAREHGFTSWVDVVRHFEAREETVQAEKRKWEETISGQVRIEAMIPFRYEDVTRTENHFYLGVGIPAAITQVLRFYGEDIDFTDLVASCGWAFSFAYSYAKQDPTVYDVERFMFLPEQLGYFLPDRMAVDEQEMVPGDKRELLWKLVCRNADAGNPVITTRNGGGLIYGYRVKDGEREIWYDSTEQGGWIPLDQIDSDEIGFVLFKRETPPFFRLGRPQPPFPVPEFLRMGLVNAAEAAHARRFGGLPVGKWALEKYAKDFENPNLDFSGDAVAWLCYGAFNQLSARKNAAAWLRRVANVLPGAESLLPVADMYQQAYEAYEEFRREGRFGFPTNLSYHERARTPEQIAVLAPILRRGVEIEWRAGDALRTTVNKLV
jgi:hypothetical protein